MTAPVARIAVLAHLVPGAVVWAADGRAFRVVGLEEHYSSLLLVVDRISRRGPQRERVPLRQVIRGWSA